MYGAYSASAINSRAAQLTHAAHTCGETQSERWSKCWGANSHNSTYTHFLSLKTCSNQAIWELKMMYTS